VVWFNRAFRNIGLNGCRESGMTAGRTRMTEPGWSLHPQLESDTVPVGELALPRVLAVNAADYPWQILVPRRLGVSELADLGADAFPPMAEIALARWRSKK
jgi:hypothetical protein